MTYDGDSRSVTLTSIKQSLPFFQRLLIKRSPLVPDWRIAGGVQRLVLIVLIGFRRFSECESVDIKGSAQTAEGFSAMRDKLASSWLISS